jgi:uncharacterized protein YaaN involved in tellurite resistance
MSTPDAGTPTEAAVAAPAAAPLVLEPPAPVAAIPPQQAADAVKLSSEEETKLDGQVADFIGQVTSLDIHGADFKARVDAISTMGNDEVQQAAQVSNRMLDRPVNSMNGGIFDGSSPVSKSLLDLRETVEKLDPSRQGDLFAPRKLLGLIPFGSKLVAYFDGYRSAQSHINAIIETLYRSKDELAKDNAAIETEKQRLWALMQRIEQYIYLGKKIDAALTARLAQLDTTEPDRAKILREDVLFYARQKVVDLLTQMAVSVQGYLALDLIKKNNVELIKGVDRATTTTVSALRTAVIVAQALANERLVLDQIKALNTTTGNLIESTSKMLRQQTSEVYNQAASSTLDVAQLQRAFDNIYATMDAVADFKVKALSNMQQTVTALSSEVDKAKTYLDRTRAETAKESMGSLSSASAPDDGVVKLLPNA